MRKTKILVLNLDATFAFSLLSIEDSFLQVLAPADDTHLGGEDFNIPKFYRFLDIFRRWTGK
jgi:molecular chaperone DnaK (HSP70)